MPKDFTLLLHVILCDCQIVPLPNPKGLANMKLGNGGRGSVFYSVTQSAPQHACIYTNVLPNPKLRNGYIYK